MGIPIVPGINSGRVTFRGNVLYGPEVSPKLHPLHTPEMLATWIKHTGCYPDPTRMTGRTTILALKALVQALENPGAEIYVRDHHDTLMSHQRLCDIVGEMAEALGLKHITRNKSSRPFVRFG